MSEPVVVIVDLHVTPEQTQRWLPLALEHLQNCVVQEGMLRFRVLRDDEDPAHFLFYEEWSDRADLTRSMNAPWFSAYVSEVEGLLTTPARMRTYRRVETPWELLEETPRSPEVAT